MMTCVEGQGTTAKNSWYDSGAITAVEYSAKYNSDANSSAIRSYDDGLLNNVLVCKEPYCLDIGSWQPATIKLEEDIVNQIAADVAKNLIKHTDPIEKNADEVEVPPMSGFVEI